MVGRLEGQLLNKAAHSAVQEILLYGSPLGVFLGAVNVIRSLGLTPRKDLGARIEATLMVPVDGRFPIPQYSGKGNPDFNLWWPVRESWQAPIAAQTTGFSSYQRADLQISSNLARERAEILRQKGAGSHLVALDAGQNVTLAAIKANRAANRLFDKKGEPNFSEASPTFLVGWVAAIGEYAAAIAEYGWVPVQFAVTRSSQPGKPDAERIDVVAGLRATPTASLPYPPGVVQLLEALQIDPNTFQTSYTPIALNQEPLVVPPANVFTNLTGPTQQQLQQLVQPITGPLEQISQLVPESIFNQITAPLVAGQEPSPESATAAAAAASSTSTGTNRTIGAPVLVLLSIAAIVLFASR